MTWSVDILVRRGRFERSLRIEQPERVIALSGPSGAGKTTLLHAIAGLSRPVRGHIRIGAMTCFDHARGIDIPCHQRRIGYVFQDARLFPHLSVRSNLMYGRRGIADSAAFGFDKIIDLLGIRPLLDRPTANLSGGEAQRVALGRALLSNPAVLLLDEPLSMLDAARRDVLIGYLQDIRDTVDIPMLIVTHSMQEASRLASAFVELDLSHED